MDNGMTKDKSKILYGIAIFMMVYHHLFLNLGSIKGEYITIIPYEFVQKIAWYCRMCIPIFAFVSGYGICCKVDEKKLIKIIEKYKLAINQIFKLLKKYWIVLIPFTIVGLVMSKIALGDFKEICLTILGISHTYNYEWWYIAQQMMMLLLFPIFATALKLLDKLLETGNKKITVSILIVMFIALALSRNLSFFSFFLDQFNNGKVVFTIVFFEGYVVRHYKLFEIGKNTEWFGKIKIVLAVLFLVSLSAIRIIRAYDAAYCKYDAFIAVPIIWSIIVLTELPVLKQVSKLIAFFGGYSTYIWLTHTFYSNYYFGEQFAKLKYAVLIYIGVFGAAFLTALLFNKIEKIIIKLGQ